MSNAQMIRIQILIVITLIFLPRLSSCAAFGALEAMTGADVVKDKEITLPQRNMQRGGPLTEQEKALIGDMTSRGSNRIPSDPLDNHGGPDAFGYMFQDNQGPDTATYAWIELRGDAQATWLNAADFSAADDGMTNNPIHIGFDFRFYGGTYNQCRISTNGDVQFTTAYPFECMSCLPRLNSGAMIAPLSTDLHLRYGGISTGDAVVGYRSFGTYWVLEFDSLGFRSTTSCPNGSLKYELILYSNGRMKFQYNHLVVPTNCYSIYAPNIGIQASDSGPDLVYACGQSGIFPADNEAIWFYLPDGIPQPVTNFAGSVTGNTVTLTWTDPTQDTNGNPLTPDSILIYRGEVAPDSQIGHVAHGVQSYAISAEFPGFKSYFAQVKAGTRTSAEVTTTVFVGQASYASNFESDGGGWEPDGVWEWGMPSNPQGPQPYSGTNVWGTGLTANYHDGVCGHLDFSPGLRVSSQTATLEFWYWYNIEQNWDGCNVSVSVDSGATWQIVSPITDYPGVTNGSWACGGQDPAWTGGGTAWQNAVIPIGQFINHYPKFRFTFGSDGSVNYAGFFFDDMTIWGLAPRQSIQGQVRDAGGAHSPIAGAQIWVAGGADTVLTDATGQYSLRVAPGTYSVHFHHPSHCDSVRNGIVVNAGENQTLDVALLAPGISLSVSSLTFVIQFPDTQQQTFTINNSGGTCPLNFSLLDSVQWLSCSPVNGTVDPGQRSAIMVTVIAAQIPHGVFETMLRVYSNAADSPRLIHVDVAVAGITETAAAPPTEFALHPNYPNPFNPTTLLPFDVPRESHVDIVIYNIMGQEVARPVSGNYPVGRYRVAFAARDLPSGLYLVKMTAGHFTSLGKMMLLK